MSIKRRLIVFISGNIVFAIIAGILLYVIYRLVSMA